MAKNRVKRVTKPIGFRLDADTVDAISADAKQAGLTIQEYFLTQIQPGSRLDKILMEAKVRMVEQSENIAKARNQMAEDAKRLRESLGLSEDAFEVAVTQAVKILIKGDSTTEQ